MFLERIEPRGDAFAAIAFTASELARIAGDRDATCARLWAAKEAVAKARGTGITDPKLLETRELADGRLAISEFVVETRREGEHVVAWTRGPR